MRYSARCSTPSSNATISMATREPCNNNLLTVLVMLAAGSVVIGLTCTGGGVQLAEAQQQRLVFAHYVVWNPLFNDTVEGFKQEILLAQNYGIDAFAINTQRWTGNDRQRPEMLYQAAQELGTGFKLFFSADFNSADTFGSLADVASLITTFKNHPNQLYYQDKQFFTSWLGTLWKGQSLDAAAWQDEILAPAGRNNVFFVPFFPTGVSVDSINAVIDKYSPVIDGVFAWDTSAWPYFNGDYDTVSTAADVAYLTACKQAGKIYMASVSPWFFNHQNTCTSPSSPGMACPSNTVMGNYKGPGLWMTRWTQLASSPDIPMVEIVSWNDWQERHYTGEGPFQPDIASHTVFPHLPFLDLGSYYISWFKTGSRPEITKDSLYIFYYTHSKNAIPTNDPLNAPVGNSDVLDDYVYVAVKLTAPASVRITSGTASQVFTVAAGLQTVGMPFQEGVQAASLLRNGDTLLTVQGDLDISNNIQQYDFNVYSKFVTSS